MRQLRFACLFSTLFSTMALAQPASSLNHAQSVSFAGIRTSAAGGSDVQSLSPAVDFDKVNVCTAGQTSPKPCSKTLKLLYNLAATTTFGKASVVTQGAPNLDFTLSGTTCKGALAAGSSCTVSATFAPRAPGVRMGAVQLMDSSGNLLATTLINGEGEGPFPAFSPSPEVVLLSGTNNVYFDYFAVAVDAAGDVFVAFDGDVVKIARNGVQKTVASGVPNVFGLAVDGAGNLFASLNFNAVVEIAGVTGAQTPVGNGLGLGGPCGLAVDKWGNLFVAENGANSVVEFVRATGVQHTLVGGGNPSTGLSKVGEPCGVAVDGTGNVFVTDVINEAVWELPEGNGGNLINLGASVLAPEGVAVDAAGDVFVADYVGPDVVEVPASGDLNTFLYGGKIGNPWAIAVDGSGDLFLAQPGYNLVELKGSRPSTLNFGKVAVGNASNPQSVTIQNVGNQPLNAVASGLSISADFLQVPGSGTPADCTSNFSLAPGASCNLSIVFAPQGVGRIKGTATSTDDALNKTPSASQTVELAGTGIQ